MPLDASKFIKNRVDVISVTSDRITSIMWYIAECYCKLLLQQPNYSKEVVNKTTNFHFEDFLKMDFVDNFLIVHKHLLISKMSSLEEITFNYETNKRYMDITDGKEKLDKIDVYISKLGLKAEWAVEDEHLYLAVECKRIQALADCQAYVEDIQKFCDREYTHMRIPFEGQIAFIENSKLTAPLVSDEINKRLKMSTSITTTQFLVSKSVHLTFTNSYCSIHTKNFKAKDQFTIFHFMFDYSALVVN